VFVGCKCRFVKSREGGMEAKERMKMNERKEGRGWKVSY
jgi:hypothetical protein